MSDILHASSVRPRENTPLEFSASTGGRPAYIISKEMIEQLRETGMNWRSIATCLGISDQTLYRRRIESAPHFTRNCLISLRVVEFWTLWMSYTCWLFNVYLPRINVSLCEFTSQWNHHGIRTVGHQTPLAMWYTRLLCS